MPIDNALFQLAQLQKILSTASSDREEILANVTEKLTHFVHEAGKIHSNNPDAIDTLDNLTAGLIHNAADSLKQFKKTSQLAGLNTDLTTKIQQTKIVVQKMTTNKPSTQQQEMSTSVYWTTFSYLLTRLQNEIIKSLIASIKPARNDYHHARVTFSRQ